MSNRTKISAIVRTTTTTGTFLPTSISGCALWLDAADPAGTGVQPANGATLASWVDKSGVGNTLTSYSSPTFATNVKNGLGAITMSGGYFQAATTSTNSGTTATLFVLAYISSTSQYSRLFSTGQGASSADYNNGSLSFMVSTEPTSTNISVFRSMASIQYTTTAVQNTYILLSIVFDGTNATMYYSGTQSSTMASTGSFGFNQMAIGRAINESVRPFSGYALEYLFYYSALTTTQRQNVEGYLAQKWGLTASLPAGHPGLTTTLYGTVVTPVPITTTTNFVPTSISGCQFWLDATDSTTITKSGSSVTSIKEKAQNIVLTAQGTSSYLTVSPTSIGTQQSLWFDNATANRVYLSASYQSILTGCVFIVWKSLPQYTVSWFPIFTWYTGGQYPAYGYLGGTTNLTVGPYTTFASPNGTPQIVTTSGQTFITFYSWSGTTPTVGQNGATPTSGTQAAFSSSTTTFWVGADNGTNTNMYLGEMIIYNSVLGTTDRQTVEGYLAQKWGLTSSLPAGHPGLTTIVYGNASLTKQKIASISRTTITSFLPTSITGCKLWLDGADSTTVVISSGSNISQWNDKSGNSANITQSTSASRPFYAASSNSVLFTDTTSMIMGNTSYFNTLLGSPFTMFFVHKRLQAAAWLLSPGCYLVTASTLLRFTTASITDLDYTLSAFTSATAEPVRIYTIQWTGTERSIRMNGQLTAYNMNNNGSTSWTNAPVVDSTWTMGPTGQSTTGNTQNMFEVLFYNSALSTTNRQTVESYLAQKWGLTSSLPATHPGLTTTVYGTITAPTTTNYTLSPTSIAGCSLWLDAADLTSLTVSGGAVSQWNDKSGNGNNATQSTSGSQPTSGSITQNGLNVLNLTSKTMTYPTISLTTMTVFCVYRQLDFTSYRQPLSVGAFAFFYAESGLVGIGRLAVTGEVSANWSTYGLSTSVYTIYGGTVSISGSTTTNMYFNGTNVASNIVNSSGGVVRYEIGRSELTNSGYIAEVLLYNTVLSQTNRQNVEGYLAQKWGLTSSLPAGHPGLTTTLYGTVTLPKQKIGFIRVLNVSSPVILTFAYLGLNQSFVVPTTISPATITVYMWGAAGGGETSPAGTGGAGAMIQGVLSVTPGQTLTILVGGGGQSSGAGGFGGGGAAANQYAGGGGRSSISISGTEVVIAGAGGGGVQTVGGGIGTFSGNGGNGSGWDGTTSMGGQGGNANGTGGAGGTGPAYNGAAAVGKLGGVGTSYSSGGGAGYGGGGSSGVSGSVGASGGGGSSLTSNLTLIPGQSVLGYNSTNGYSAPNSSSPYYQAGVAAGVSAGNGGNGLVVITYTTTIATLIGYSNVRYVRITGGLNNDGWNDIAEIRIFDSTGTNLCSGKTINQATSSGGFPVVPFSGVTDSSSGSDIANLTSPQSGGYIIDGDISVGVQAKDWVPLIDLGSNCTVYSGSFWYGRTPSRSLNAQIDLLDSSSTLIKRWTVTQVSSRPMSWTYPN